MPRIATSVENVPRSRIRELAEVAMGMDGVLRLYFGESNLPTPDYIKQAAVRAMRDGYTFYTEKSLRLNQARIDSLVEQLYDINKRLVSNEGRLMRLSESYGVAREDFIKQYMGGELDPRWLNRVSKLSAKGWKNFVAKEKDRIKEIRSLVHDLAAQTGVEIGEFRKIVHMVQKGERTQ